MDPRVLELLKNPKNILSEDLNLLKQEIHAFPYVQNIRALHLYGVHLYDKENYQKELSVTAAYTTDKKILYQLINGKIQQTSAPERAEEKKPSKPSENEVKYVYKDKGFPIKRDQSAENGVEKKDDVPYMPEPPKEIKPIFVNGERNRILFEGEENFLDEKNTGTIDIESTLESGTLVVQRQAVVEELPVEEATEKKAAVSDESQEEFTPETIINEDEIALESEKEEIKDDSALSFHETEALPAEIEDNEEEDHIVEEPAEDQKEVVVAEETDHQTEIPEEVNPEEIINVSELNVQEEEKVEQDDAELSFHGMEAFLPDVKIQANTGEIATAEVIQPSANKHEDEMRRLIEEVEKKMKVAKESASETKSEEPEETDHGISFAETQQFHFWSTEKEDKPKIHEIDHNQHEVEAESIETIESQEPVIVETEIEPIEEEVKSAWKPMTVEAHIPDSLLNKPAKDLEQKIEAPKPEPEVPETTEKTENVEVTTEPEQQDNKLVSEDEKPVDTEVEDDNTAVEKEKQNEAPVMNVSFFSSDISSLPVARAEKEEVNEKEEMTVEKENIQNILDSNVPGFINTWQSWLKIDRPEEAEEPKTEDKIKVIDAFIENNPKISQLREEGSYVIREKKGDISHLMTETLANLYVEQKLYSKAIKAFEILKNKYPEKIEHFNAKIAHVNDIKSGK